MGFGIATATEGSACAASTYRVNAAAIECKDPLALSFPLTFFLLMNLPLSIAMGKEKNGNFRDLQNHPVRSHIIQASGLPIDLEMWQQGSGN